MAESSRTQPVGGEPAVTEPAIEPVAIGPLFAEPHVMEPIVMESAVLGNDLFLADIEGMGDAADEHGDDSGSERYTTVRIPEDLAERLRALAGCGLKARDLRITGPRARVSVTRLVEEVLRSGLPALERRVDRIRAEREAARNQFSLNVRRGRLVVVPPPSDS